jgi:hypothetical protein
MRPPKVKPDAMAKARTYALILASLGALASGGWRLLHEGYSVAAALSIFVGCCSLFAAFALKNISLDRN